MDYLEDAMDQLKALNPLRAKERKINLLTDSDEEEEEEVCKQDFDENYNNTSIGWCFGEVEQLCSNSRLCCGSLSC